MASRTPKFPRASRSLAKHRGSTFGHAGRKQDIQKYNYNKMYHTFNKNLEVIKKNINAETNTHHGSQQTTNFPPFSPVANQRTPLPVDCLPARSMASHVTRTRPPVTHPPITGQCVIPKVNVDSVGSGNLDNEARLFTSGICARLRITRAT